MPATDLAFLPSPSRSVWELGPIPIRAYALCIILGIVAAIWIGERRWVARGGRRGTVSDVAVWAVVSGLIGGRLYHVITDNELYFRPGRDPWRALYVWEGGLGIWGAIALGGVGAWIACRRRGIRLPPFADACAPGIAVAQAIGRWGNWFNQELFGRPTDLPWAVEIDPGRPNTVPGESTYHPTFLYESLWCLALAGVLVWADRRFRMGRGRVFALYVMGYTAGRVWIEMLRIDTSDTVFGVRLNVWTSILVFTGALIYFLLHRGPRETVVEPGPPEKAEASAAAGPSAGAAAPAETVSGEADTPGAEGADGGDKPEPGPARPEADAKAGAAADSPDTAATASGPAGDVAGPADGSAAEADGSAAEADGSAAEADDPAARSAAEADDPAARSAKP